MCTYSALPESPSPGLSLSDLPLPAAAAAAVLVGGADHDNDDVDGDGGGGCFDVRSAITTPVLDGRWDENALTHTNMLFVFHALRERVRQKGGR